MRKIKLYILGDSVLEMKDRVIRYYLGSDDIFKAVCISRLFIVPDCFTKECNIKSGDTQEEVEYRRKT
ncbi:MAG: hypothetical protein LBP54_02225 [Campylobacteraceae bacterium]|jgi:hypothetical protein|nr:hypothetical protein [Campylobacteraceae bacterium]